MVTLMFPVEPKESTAVNWKVPGTSREPAIDKELLRIAVALNSGIGGVTVQVTLLLVWQEMTKFLQRSGTVDERDRLAR